MGAMVYTMQSIGNFTGSYVQSQQEAQLKKMQAELAADGLEAQAERKDLEAAEALKIGELNMSEQAMRGRLDMATQRAAYGASGVRVDSGSTREVLADKAAWNEYERQKIEYEANFESWGLSYDAALLRQEAANTRASGATLGSGSGLQTAMKAGSAFFEVFK